MSAPRLLVRLPSWLGDLVMAEPALRALYERWEAAGAAERVSLAAPAQLLPLLEQRFARARRIAHAGRSGERASEWQGHEIALLFNNSWRSAFTALRAGIPRRVGWSRGGRGLLLSEALGAPREHGRAPLGLGKHGELPRFLPRPYGASCAELVSALGVPVRDARPRIEPCAAGLRAADERLARFGLAQGGAFALVQAGGRLDSAKTAPAWLFAPALRAFWERTRMPLVLVCGPGEERQLQLLHGKLGAALAWACTEPIADLRELAALCARARVVLCGDGGPRHVAQAVGARFVCAFGPTDARHTADATELTTRLAAEVPCGPCHLERCALPREQELACWHKLGAERVTEALLQACAPG